MQPLPLEFEQDDSLAGYRLHQLEVLNWGTFDGRIWAIEPAGHTALLTGANGSGKSTLVDGLLTLLVPNVKRNYNLASGSDRKRERTEKTYMLGAYGNVKREDSYQAKVQYLRDETSFSILLAHFFNQGFREHVTLAQVFWIRNEKVDKTFVIAPRRLTIQDDFSGFSSIADLKARLKASKVEVFDTFSDYSSRFRRAFGLRTEKALDLFNQTVTIKAIGDLNDFIRTHMLEKGDVDERIDDLRRNYENLSRAHEAIRTARRQLEQLAPLCAEARQRAKVLEEIQEMEALRQILPGWFAQKKRAFLHTRRIEKEEELAGAQNELAQSRARAEALREQERSLVVAISRDAATGRIREIEGEIRNLDERRTLRQAAWKRVETAVQALDLPMPDSAAAFDEMRGLARELREELDAALSALDLELVDALVDEQKLKAARKELDAELDSLRKRRSQIPDRNLQLRARILEGLEISEKEIPFVGELLRVRPEERRWEGAIERLLHDFALCLLVPDGHYQRVSRFVNQTDLKGRVVYHRVQTDPGWRVTSEIEPDSVVRKLEIKPDTPLQSWIEQELGQRYDYVCCDDFDRFRREKYAVTESGLIKAGRTRHEKDDRHALHDRTRYVLGWSNREKIEAIAAEAARVQREIDAKTAEVNAIRARKERLEEDVRRLRDLLEVEQFADVDWQSVTREIQHLTEERKDLEAASDTLRALRGQLEEVKVRIADAEAAKETVAKKVNNLERDLQEIAAEMDVCDGFIAVFRPEELEAHGGGMARLIGKTVLSLEICDRLRKEVGDRIQDTLDKRAGTLRRLEGSLMAAMKGYLSDYPTFAAEADAALESIPEFERIHARIAKEDLPRHEKRFKELLDEKVVMNMALFRARLDDEEKDIRKNIQKLNGSLHAIDYTQSTYIQLGAQAVKDAEIREFKGMLRDCTTAAIGTDEAANEVRFEKIKALIERFDAEPRWRAKVTDVRNWLDFSASERYRADDSEKNYYSDSSGRSGGQKAKLAYTILASAIAFQFGLDFGEPRSKSFRFVVIDEAFSRSDETNARYAMELFRKLNLQLLVVSPLDKTHVVEPYINACHFVTNTDEENDSRVYNLTMEEYFERKRQYRHVVAFGTGPLASEGDGAGATSTPDGPSA